jgi:hypothetical protein
MGQRLFGYAPQKGRLSLALRPWNKGAFHPRQTATWNQQSPQARTIQNIKQRFVIA